MKNFISPTITSTILLFAVNLAVGQPGNVPRFPPKPDKDSVEKIIGKMESSGPSPALERVFSMLRSADPMSRMQGIESASELGLFDFDFADNLTRFLQDDSLSVRLSAITTLQNSGVGEGTFSEQLKKMLDSRNALERALAAKALIGTGDQQDKDRSLGILNQGLRSNDSVIVNESAAALVAAGQSDAFVDGLENDDAAIRALSVESLGRLGNESQRSRIVELLKDVDPEVRAAAAFALGRIGTRNSEEISELGHLLKDNEASVRVNAVNALAATLDAGNQPINDQIVKLTKDENDQVAVSAINALLEIHPSHVKLESIFSNLVKNKSGRVSSHALYALSEQGDKAVPKLKEMLLDPNTRFEGALGLSSFSARDTNANAELIESLKSSDAATQIEILMGIAGNPKDCAKNVEQISPLLSSKNAGVQYAATYAVANAGVASNDTMARLRANANSDNRLLKTLSFWANAKLNPESSKAKQLAAQKLIEAASSDDPVLQRTGISALSDINLGSSDVESTVPQMLQILRSADLELKELILEHISKLIVDAKAFDILRPQLSDPVLCQLAMPVVEKMGANAKPLQAEVVNLLDSDNALIRQQSLFTLAAMGAQSSETVRKIMKLLSDRNPEIQLAASYCLGAVDSNETSLQQLQQMIVNSHGLLDQTSAISLAYVSKDKKTIAAKILPFLFAATKSNNPNHVSAAISAIGELGSNGEAAIPLLIKLSNRSNISISSAATNALKRVQ